MYDEWQRLIEATDETIHLWRRQQKLSGMLEGGTLQDLIDMALDHRLWLMQQRDTEP